MNFKNKIAGSAILILATCITIISCQKMDRPTLGNFPKDSNPPGGPLKFYAALDGTSVDSIRANFGADYDVSYVPGLSGQAAQMDGTKNGYITWHTANDFGTSSNFTISFWMKITLAQKDNSHAVGVFAFANSENFWGNVTFYADNTTKGNSDSMDLKIHFNAQGNGDVWDAAGYTGAKRWPHMYDGEWHQVAITYNASNSQFTAYRDGVQFDQMTLGNKIVFENSSQLILGGFQEAAGISSTYADNSWMAGFPGMFDNVRLYGTTLTAAEIAALYAAKL